MTVESCWSSYENVQYLNFGDAGVNIQVAKLVNVLPKDLWLLDQSYTIPIKDTKLHIHWAEWQDVRKRTIHGWHTDRSGNIRLTYVSLPTWQLESHTLFHACGRLPSRETLSWDKSESALEFDLSDNKLSLSVSAFSRSCVTRVLVDEGPESSTSNFKTCWGRFEIWPAICGNVL